MSDKLNFFEWFAAQEADEGEDVKDLLPWTEKYFTKTAWESYRTSEPIHDGDCVKRPYTCDLCVIERYLTEYKNYFFDRE